MPNEAVSIILADIAAAGATAFARLAAKKYWRMAEEPEKEGGRWTMPTMEARTIWIIVCV
jgi:hypothetical protein